VVSQPPLKNNRVLIWRQPLWYSSETVLNRLHILSILKHDFFEDPNKHG
jgi:hypothetical protein